MNIQLRRIIFLLSIFYLPVQTLFSQSYSSKDNYTGTWQNPSSWIPTWPIPQTNFTGNYIAINGYIIANSTLSFSSQSTLNINDTLVIEGDLSLGDHTVIAINDNGILIVRGNLLINDHSIILANGYLIITGNVTKTHAIDHGSFTSNDNPVKVFIGGTITPIKLTENNPTSPIFNCSAPLTIPYPNSICSYGNLTDLKNDPLYPFFHSACTITTPTITASGPTTFCAGGSVTLISSPNSTYLWSTGATSQSINVTTAGSYTVQVTNANECLSASSAATIVKVNSLPVTPTITASGPTTFCAGGGVTLTSSADSTYLWSTGATTASINVTITGSYTVKVANASGCQSVVSIPTVVTVNALPATPTISTGGPTTFCEGGNVTLTSSPGSTYLWSTGAITQSINVATAGSYTVRVTDANGCQNLTSAATMVIINSSPVVNAGVDATIPNGTSTTINATVTGPGPFTYSWSPSGQLVNAFVEDPTTTNLITTTIFSLTATSMATSCSSTDEVIITISGGPLSSTPVATPGTLCAGESVQLHAMASGGSGSYTHTWTSTPAGFTSTIADPIANPTVNTTYNVAVFDGFTTVNSQITVTVNAIPATPTIMVSGPTTFCGGGNVTLTSSAGITYLWSNGETTPSINVTLSGSYSVKVTNANGCQSRSSTVTVVTVNALPATPTIITSGPTAFCSGGSVTLTSSAGTSYLWSNGEATPSINIALSGSYTVQITNTSGCQSAVSVGTIVTVNALPAIPIIDPAGAIAICEGSSITLTSGGGSTFLWSNGETTQKINTTASGSYTVQVIDANGCQSAMSSATVVTLNALPGVKASNNGPICEGNSLTLTGEPSGMAAYSWTGPGGFTSVVQSPSIFTGSTIPMAGDYYLSVTDVIGCTNTAVTTVIINPLPVVNITSSNSPMCTNELRNLTGSPAGGTFNISGGPGIFTGNVLSATSAGNIILEYTYSNVCTNKATQSIIVNEAPQAFAGLDQELNFNFETQMTADLSTPEIGEWSLVSGSGHFGDINSPKTRVTELSVGENEFLWKVRIGNCEDSAKVKITVNDLIVPSVITPDGDGKNDYFKIGELISKVQLIIFNKWGNEEYTSDDYLNDWNGQNDKGTDLPEDTYFYILKFENGRIKKGSVLIKR